MKLFIKTLANQGFDLVLPGGSPTLSNLQQAIASKVGCNANELKLVFKGKVLKTDVPLSSAGVSTGDRILMAMSAVASDSAEGVPQVVEFTEQEPIGPTVQRRVEALRQRVTGIDSKFYGPLAGLVALLAVSRAGFGGSFLMPSLMLAGVAYQQPQLKARAAAWYHGVPIETWARVCVIGFGWWVAIKAGFGAVFAMAALGYVIWFNLSDDAKNGPSAYSVFNRNFQPLPGQLNQDQLIPGRQQQ